MVIYDWLIKVSVKILELQREVLFAYKDTVSDIKKPLKRGEVKVVSHLYNKFLLIFTYSQTVFRLTERSPLYEDNKDTVKDMDKSIKEIVKDIKYYEEYPDENNIYIRLNRNTINKALKMSDSVFTSLKNLGKQLERDVDHVDNENYNHMKLEVQRYVSRASALINLLYSMKIMMKHVEKV